MHAKKNAAQQSLSAQKSKTHRLISTTQERLKELKQNQEQQRKLSLTLASSAKQNNRVLDTVALILPFGYDKPLHISLDYGDRIHLIGSNGSGKSTLLKCIAGLIIPRQGQIYKRSQPIYLDQHFGMLKNASDSVQTYIQKKCAHLTEMDIRTLLAGIGFRRDRVYQQLSTLSGGELMKIAMLSVSHQQEKNILLLLDEPDNHLDLEAKKYLAQIIQEYQGPFLLVSHDKNFTHSISFNKLLDLSPIT
jgi:ATPase subunit of ABC transporter with duplicated ATPase domains